MSKIEASRAVAVHAKNVSAVAGTTQNCRNEWKSTKRKKNNKVLGLRLVKVNTGSQTALIRKCYIQKTSSRFHIVCIP